MSDRAAIVEIINRLFIATDNKDWPGVRSVLAEKVHFDMTSLAGGDPLSLTPDQITGAWEAGLAEVTHVHHQASNYLVTVDGDRADAFCYATATHFREEGEPELTTFVGTYDFHLVRLDGAWRIDLFRFNKKYVRES